MTETQGGKTTVTSYTYDSDDRLTQEAKTQGASTATTTYAWDANGNLTKKVEPSQTTLYAWDGHNRLVAVKRGTTEVTAQTVATYQYDANGNRVGKTKADGTKIAYLVDANTTFAQVVEETATQGTAKESTVYLYGANLIRQTRGGRGSYHLNDGLGSTRLLTDEGGNTADAYDYEAYGNIQNLSGSSKNEFLFAGEQFDAEAGLYYNRARWMDANTGRFTGVDPFEGSPGQPVTLNKYAYAGGDPVNATDPSGLFSLGGMMSSIGAVISASLPNIGRSIIKEVIKGKKMAVYKGRKTMRTKLFGAGFRFIPHFFVFIEPITARFGLGMGYSYDIGAENAGQYFKDVFTNGPAITTKGFIVKREISRAKLRSEGARIDSSPSAQFTIMQWEAWELAAYVPFMDGFDYCLIGTNCATWTVMAIKEAKLAQKVPLYP